MALYPGSTDTLTLTVDPFDGTTAAEVEVTSPDGGTVLEPTASTTDSGNHWSANPIYTATGKWVAKWTVTGVGAGVVYADVWVSRAHSPATVVGWRPELWNVAAYVPRRTLVGAVDGSGIVHYTFTNDTTPTGAAVQHLVTGSVSWVLLKTGTVQESLWDSARDCAAMRAAGLVELTYPDNRDDLTDGFELLKQSEQMRKDLAAANIALGVDDPSTSDDDLLPQFVFPAAVNWGDELF